MDLIISSADIYTGDIKKPYATALGIKNGKIAVIGNDEEVMPHATSASKVLHLPGKLITAGLVDSHIHFVSTGIQLQMLDLRNENSLEACKEKIRQIALTSEKGKWITARGWNNFKWDNKKDPVKFDLDQVAPDNPVMMTRVCGHSAVINSMALNICNIDRNSNEPAGGKIGRLNNGEPNGIIYEALDLITDNIPALSENDKKEAVLAAQDEALKYGITGVHSIERISEWEAIHGVQNDNDLKIRVYNIFPEEELQKISNLNIIENTKSDNLWYGHCKLFADGSLGASTALTQEPYTSDPNQYGIAFLEKEELIEKITNAYDLGFNVAVHAIGDMSLKNTIDAIEIARERTKNLSGLKKSDRIEHVQLFKAEELVRMKELKIIASVQPVFLSTDYKTAEKQWGKERCKRAYAWKTIQDMNIPMQFGSDSPVEPPNPMLGIHAAYTRQTPCGHPENGWFPDQKLTMENIIRGFTLQPAITSGREKESGSLSVGKNADLTVFSENLFKTPADSWIESGVELTIVAGQILYRKN